jgi:acyl-coenzyme A synthetase/AMP-(fatty) acid ligase
VYPGAHAKAQPDKPALIMASTGRTITYAELDERSNRVMFRKSNVLSLTPVKSGTTCAGAADPLGNPAWSRESPMEA